MKTVNGKVISYTPLVESSKTAKYNFYGLVFPYLILVGASFPHKTLFYIGLACMIPVIIMLKECQKNHKENIKKWVVANNVPKVISFDTEKSIIDLNGLEIAFENIEKIKIHYNQPPKMKGFSGGLISTQFINCNMEINIKGNKTVNVILHSKEDIKSIINLLSEYNVNATYDQHIYSLCKV